jgi:radical SAM superfamily enzyme YgiQ (UPF0313 family)
MRVLLVQPPSNSRYGLQAFMLTEPLGLELIASSLESEHEVLLLDMRLEPSLHQKLTSFKPDAVGVSASFTSDIYNSFQVLDIVKKYNPYIFTFAGGQHATMAHADFISRADAVVLGEGEITVRELLRCWEKEEPLETVSGLVFSRNHSWIETGPRQLITNLDESPLPARQFIRKYLPHYFITSRQPIASMETSRGCAHRCKFCSVWRFFRNTFRSRSPQRVVEELRQIESQDVLITDDSALSDPVRSESLVDEIKKAGIRKRYLMQIRADSIVKYPHVLTKWKSIGLESVFVGFESINQRGLDELGKRLPINYIEEAIATLQSLDINLMGSFIVTPDFDKEDFAALRYFVRRMKLRSPAFSILTPLPGTVLHEERSPEITSHNYELYDLLHATLPTRLGLKEFYRQFVRLYTSAYFQHVTLRGLLRPLMERRLRSHLSQASKWLTLFNDNSPQVLVRHHRLPAGRLSQSRFPKQVPLLKRLIKWDSKPDSLAIANSPYKTRYSEDEMPQMPV